MLGTTKRYSFKIRCVLSVALNYYIGDCGMIHVYVVFCIFTNYTIYCCCDWLFLRLYITNGLVSCRTIETTAVRQKMWSETFVIRTVYFFVVVFIHTVYKQDILFHFILLFFLNFISVQSNLTVILKQFKKL